MTCQCGPIVEVATAVNLRMFQCACQRVRGTVTREELEAPALAAARLANLEQSFRAEHNDHPEWQEAA